MSEDSMDSTAKPVSNVISIDEERVRGHLDRIVRSSVEETLNGLLDAEADRLVGADRYQRTEQRRDYRSGHYERKLHTKAGEVTRKVPKLRKQTLDTAIIERYVSGGDKFPHAAPNAGGVGEFVTAAYR